MINYLINEQKLQNKIKHNPNILDLNSDPIIELVCLHTCTDRSTNTKEVQLQQILLTWLVSDTDRQTYSKNTGVLFKEPESQDLLRHNRFGSTDLRRRDFGHQLVILTIVLFTIYF